jgi:hypothetical protein
LNKGQIEKNGPSSLGFSSDSLEGHYNTVSVVNCEGDAKTTDFLASAFPASTVENVLFAQWLRDLCPEVVEHFMRFPYFDKLVEDLPIMTSAYAAHSVCSIQIALHIAAGIDSPVYLHAGSHLGAVRHAGPVPWDDDVDLLIPLGQKGAFMRKCNELNDTLLHRDITVACIEHRNALKLVVTTNYSTETTQKWKSPFVDIFHFVANGTHLMETNPNGKPTKVTFALNDFFPTRPYLFGGITVLGPQEVIAQERYNQSKCLLGSYNHRLEKWTQYKGSRTLQCCMVKRAFPFVTGGIDLSNGWNKQTLVPADHIGYKFAMKPWWMSRDIKNG